MNNIEIINESERKGNISNIMRSSSHMYSHIMKVISIRPILTGWIGTIKNQIKELNKITNSSHWREVLDNPTRLSKIKEDALKDYAKDGNLNGEIYFNLVYNDINDISKFKDKEFIKNYLISKLDPRKDKDMIDYIKNELS